jgi:aminoglycoside phosphotransferase (APT) family kinase protein
MVLDRVLDRSTIDQLGQYIDKPAIEGLAGFLDRNKVSILDLLNRMPTFIFHLDLHEGNVLLDAAGEPKVIDWEQWAIAPLGFGWSSMDPEGGLPAIDMHRLRAARPLPDAIRERDLWLMAAIWGCYSALEREDHRLAATWLQRLPSLMAEEANIR